MVLASTWEVRSSSNCCAAWQCCECRGGGMRSASLHLLQCCAELRKHLCGGGAVLGPLRPAAPNQLRHTRRAPARHGVARHGSPVISHWRPCRMCIQDSAGQTRVYKAGWTEPLRTRMCTLSNTRKCTGRFTPPNGWHAHGCSVVQELSLRQTQAEPADAAATDPGQRRALASAPLKLTAVVWAGAAWLPAR